MKPFVNKDTCIGCGLCASLDSAVFFMDDDGKAEAVEADIDEAGVSDALDAERSCPVNAISVE